MIYPKMIESKICELRKDADNIDRRFYMNYEEKALQDAWANDLRDHADWLESHLNIEGKLEKLKEQQKERNKRAKELLKEEPDMKDIILECQENAKKEYTLKSKYIKVFSKLKEEGSALEDN